MKIDISDDTALSIVADVMVHDYLLLQADIERYQDKPILSDVEKADLKSWIRAMEAIDIALDYYLGYEWKKRYVG
jgi:hypothetical protein